MSKRPEDPAVYIWDMLHEMEYIERYAVGNWTDDPLISRAMLRCFTVPGEAAKRVDVETKQKRRTSHGKKSLIRAILSAMSTRI